MSSARGGPICYLVFQLQTQLFRELATRGQNWTMSRNKARKRELSVHKPGRLARGGHGRAPAIELHLFESAAMCFTQSERSLRSFLGPKSPSRAIQSPTLPNPFLISDWTHRWPVAHRRSPSFDSRRFGSMAWDVFLSEGPTNLPHGLGVPKKKTTNPRTRPVDNVYNGRCNVGCRKRQSELAWQRSFRSGEKPTHHLDLRS